MDLTIINGDIASNVTGNIAKNITLSCLIPSVSCVRDEDKQELTKDVTELLSDVEEDIPEDRSVSIGNSIEENVDTLGNLIDKIWQATVKSVLVCGAALGLGIYPARSVGQRWPLFVWRTYGPENSVTFTDPFTFLHFASGMITYLMWGWITLPGDVLGPEISTSWQDYGGLSFALVVSMIFEIFENSDHVLDSFQMEQRLANRFYFGDSDINVLGDMIFVGLGYNIAKFFGEAGLFWVPIVWVFFSEVFCAATFRDSLVLSVVQYLFPQDFISEWQDGLIPEHMRGIMTAGYWDNKIRDTPEAFLDKMVARHPSINPTSFQRLAHNQFGVSKMYWHTMGQIMDAKLRSI